MSTKISWTLLGLLLFIALFRDLIANGRPLYCKIGGESYWPGLRSLFVDPAQRYNAPALNAIAEQSQFEAWKDPANFDEPPIYALIPFTPGEYSSRNLSGLLPPGTQQPGLSPRFVHWLGTDADGRDVAATMISGSRIALLTGSVAMGMALLIGLGLGTLAGYYGDGRLRVRRGRLWVSLIGLPIAYFYAFVAGEYGLFLTESTSGIGYRWAVFLLLFLVFNTLGLFASRISILSKPVVFAADLAIMRLAEVFNALPKIIVIIALSVVLKRENDSIWLLIAMIGAMSWTGVASFVRAELLRIRELDYVTAARGLGLPEARILLRHALPNALRPMLVALAFGVAGAVLLEASLSYLGFGGESLKGVSWGSLLARNSANVDPVNIWWVMLPPGLMICFTVLALNSLGEKISER